MRSARATPNPLASASLVLAPSAARRRRYALAGLAVTAALLAGAAGAHLYWRERIGAWKEHASALQELERAEQALEQSRLQLRLSDARSQELERAVDALNQQLREAREEVAFLRRARDGAR